MTADAPVRSYRGRIAARAPGARAPILGADLIASRWPRLIAYQVRARRLSEPAEDKRPAARRSLRLSTSAWLARKAALGFEELRFDRIDVYLSAGGELVGLEHYPNAF